MLLLDPAWNPATEDQCFDRIHRLGQKEDVVVTRFIMKERWVALWWWLSYLHHVPLHGFVFPSIEEKMLEIQDKKKKLIAGAFRQSDNERRQQRIQDIRDIFGLWNRHVGYGEWIKLSVIGNFELLKKI